MSLERREMLFIFFTHQKIKFPLCRPRISERASELVSLEGREGGRTGPGPPPPSQPTHSLTLPHSLPLSVRPRPSPASASLPPSLSWPFSTFIALFGRN